MVPKKANPVSTAAVGSEELDEKPTAEKEPFVGMMYSDRVELNETEDEFAAMFHGTAVSSSSTVKVMAVVTEAFREA